MRDQSTPTAVKTNPRETAGQGYAGRRIPRNLMTPLSAIPAGLMSGDHPGVAARAAAAITFLGYGPQLPERATVERSEIPHSLVASCVGSTG